MVGYSPRASSVIATHVFCNIGAILFGSTAYTQPSASVEERPPSSETEPEASSDRPELGSGAMLSLDVGFGSPLFHDFIFSGLGLGLRVGYRMDLGTAALIPELGFDYHNLSTDEEDDQATVVIGKVGGRIQFLEFVQPSIFAYVGVGHLGSFRMRNTGFAYELGVALDVALLSSLAAGIHGAVSVIADSGDAGEGDGGIQVFDLGLHVAAVL
jgi:hypothetical protein